MQQSTVYKELEVMLQKGVLAKSPTEFDQLLKQLMKDRKITNADYRSLLEIYFAKQNWIH